MTATLPIKALVQKPTLGAEIVLYVLDLSKYGAGVHRLVGGDEGSTIHSVTFDGDLYAAWPTKTEGWKTSGDGVMPRPTFAIANTDGIFTAIVATNNDLKGCTVTRMRTYDRYLDTGVDPDPAQILPIEVYKINRLVSLSDTEIQFELVSLMDQQDVMLPGRQAVRDYCSHTYRQPDGVGGFVYVGVTCPYVGTDYFDVNDADAAAGADVCGKRLGSCRKRFGTAELPFRGFPGMGRIRLNQ